MAGNVCNQMKKEALFRPKPSPELVQELQMLDEGNVAAFEGRDIATFDLAIIRTLPRLKGISANLRKQLINSNDEQTIESMARYMPDNEILELTDQQLGYQPVVLGLLDREPLSVEIMTRMSRLPDGVGPLNLALRENLPLDIVMTLAKRDWDMIIQELYKDAWLLPESIIDGYIRSDDSSGRYWRTTHLQSGNAVGERFIKQCCHKLSVQAGRDETPWSIIADDATRE